MAIPLYFFIIVFGGILAVKQSDVSKICIHNFSKIAVVRKLFTVASKYLLA